jgi:hypothetical protein
MSRPKGLVNLTKGAPPPDKTAPYNTVDKAETSKDYYVSERATLIDDNVSDVEFAPQPGE